MAEAFRQIAERYPGREAIVCGESHATYGQVLDRVSALAFGLHCVGIQKGDVVATSLPPASSSFTFSSLWRRSERSSLHSILERALSIWHSFW